MTQNARQIYDDYIQSLPASEQLKLLALIAKHLGMEVFPVSEPFRAKYLNKIKLGNEADEYTDAIQDELDDCPPAFLISYEAYQELEEYLDHEALFAILDEIRALNKDATPEQVEADVKAAIAEVRANNA